MQLKATLHERNPAALFHFPAVYCGTLLGVFISFFVIIIYPPAAKQVTLSGQLMQEPGLPEIIAGILVGWFFYRRLPSRLAFAAWLPPAVFLSWSALSWHRTIPVYDSTWDTYFGRNCGGSECLYELFLTMPLYASLGYLLGAGLCKLLRAHTN